MTASGGWRSARVVRRPEKRRTGLRYVLGIDARLLADGGILLACDSIQNWQGAKGVSLLAGMMMPLMGFRGRACIGPGWRKASEPKDGKGFGPGFERLLALSPDAVLSRGYSLTLDEETGAVVRSATDTKVDRKLRIRLATGRLGARVEEVEP